jgi:Flp pilus assembly pilin Flp
LGRFSSGRIHGSLNQTARPQRSGLLSQIEFTAGSWFHRSFEHVIALVWKFRADETDATAIAYGSIAAGISFAIIAIVHRLGTQRDPRRLRPTPH